MSKSFRYVNIDHDIRKKYFEVPDKCLTAVVVNGGQSTIQVDNSVQLSPNQVFPYPQMPGYYLKQKIKIQIVNDANKTLETKVRIRLALEND